MLVEVCANSLESALNAEQGGADRIELCSELGVGGITPSYGLISEVLRRLTIPVHVLIRARSGHFCYSDFEMDVMLEDIEFCKKVGVKGIVAGVLLDDFTIDVQRTSLLIENSRPMKFTFHRAFDWVPNPEEALALLETLHVDYILSSGKQESAAQGLELLKKLQARTQTTQIMAGAGINLKNVIEFKKQGLKAVHLSGTLFEKNIELPEKILLNSSQHLSEHKVAVTKEHIIRQIIKIVK